MMIHSTDSVRAYLTLLRKDGIKVQLSTVHIAVIALGCLVVAGGAVALVMTSDQGFELNDIPDLSKEYDGKAVEYEATLSKGTAYTFVEWYSGDVKLESAPSNPGSYKVVATAADGNTTITKDREFVISKADNVVTINNLNNLNRKYNGNILDDPEITVLGGADYNYYWLKDSDSILTPKNAGMYMLRVVVKECDYYKETVDIINITISKVSSDTPVTFDLEGQIMSNMPWSILYEGWHIGNFDVNELSYTLLLYEYDNADKTSKTLLGEINDTTYTELEHSDFGYCVGIFTENQNFLPSYYYDLTVYEATGPLPTTYKPGEYHFYESEYEIMSFCKNIEGERTVIVYGSDGERLIPYSVEDIPDYEFYFANDKKFFCYMKLTQPTSNIYSFASLMFAHTDPSYIKGLNGGAESEATYFVAFKATATNDFVYIDYDEEIMEVYEMVKDEYGVWSPEWIFSSGAPIFNEGDARFFIVHVYPGVTRAEITFAS